MKTYPFELMALPYAANALAPVISEETVMIHHGKHLQTYVTNLNTMVADTPFAQLPLEEIVKTAEGGMFNNAAQMLNHNLYFEQLRAPRADNAPTGRLGEAITQQFGSFDAFRQQLSQAATALFGSGWAWLSVDAEGKLHITQNGNADNPLCHDLQPLLCIDVWEHAYYVDYRNRRADHVSAIWQLFDWDVVAQRYATALGL